MAIKDFSRDLALANTKYHDARFKHKIGAEVRGVRFADVDTLYLEQYWNFRLVGI